MANNRIYTKAEIEALKEGLTHYFPRELGLPNSIVFVNDRWSDSNRIFNYKNRDEYFKLLSETTGVKGTSVEEIKRASMKLEEIGKNAPETVVYKGAEETGVKANMPKEEILEGKAVEERLAESKKYNEESNLHVRDTLEKKREIAQKQAQAEKIQEDFKKSNTKIYYKIKATESKETEEVSNLRKQANLDPRRFIEDTSDKFKQAFNNSNLSKEEINVVSKQAAVSVYETLSYGDSSLIRLSIVNKLVSDPSILSNISDSDQLKNIFSEAIIKESTKFELLKSLLDVSKIKELDSKNLQIEISNTKQEGFEEFNIGQKVIRPYTEDLDLQSSLIDDVADLGMGDLKSKILLKIGDRLETHITNLPLDSVLAKAYNSDIVKLGLSSIGLVRATPWVAVEGGSIFGKIAVESGLGPLAGFIQNKTGLDLGVKLAVEAGKKVSGEVVSEVVVAKSTEAATGTGLTAILTPLFAWAGPFAPILASVASFITTSAVGKFIANRISEFKIWLQKNNLSDALPALLVGGVSSVFIGGWGLGLGLGTFGFLKLKGSTPIGRDFFLFKTRFLIKRIMNSALKMAVGPIIFTFVVFPIIVALILFIINSGAYIVPPSLNEFNVGGFFSPYVEITKTPNPTGPFENSDLPKEITYTINIKPKKGDILNTTVTYGCEVISKNDLSCPDIELEGVDENFFSTPQSINAAGITFSYKSTYDSSYKDSAIIDFIKLEGMSPSDGAIVSTQTSAYITFGNPPIDCPVPGAIPLNSMNYSYDATKNTGHGSTAYWNAMGGAAYRYAMPQGSGCDKPDECSYYGYSYDVFPTGSQEVFAPTVLGKDVTWSCRYAFSNGNAGHTFRCISSDGNYMLSLTHMSRDARIGTIKSGQKIGILFPQAGNTHLHIEFQLNGVWQKPENFFCRKK